MTLVVDASNILRRLALHGQISEDAAALAESLEAELATLDARLAGPRCRFRLPPA